MLSFHVKFLRTDRETVKQYAPDLSIRRHENIPCHIHLIWYWKSALAYRLVVATVNSSAHFPDI